MLVKKDLAEDPPSEVFEQDDEETEPNQEAEGDTQEAEGEQDGEGEGLDQMDEDLQAADATMIVSKLTIVRQTNSHREKRTGHFKGKGISEKAIIHYGFSNLRIVQLFFRLKMMKMIWVKANTQMMK